MTLEEVGILALTVLSGVIMSFMIFALLVGVYLFISDVITKIRRHGSSKKDR